MVDSDFEAVFPAGLNGPTLLFGRGELEKIRLPDFGNFEEDDFDADLDLEEVGLDADLEEVDLEAILEEDDLDDFEERLEIGDFEEEDGAGFDRKIGPILDGRFKLELGERLDFDLLDDLELLDEKVLRLLLDDFPLDDLLLNAGFEEDFEDFDEEDDRELPRPPTPDNPLRLFEDEDEEGRDELFDGLLREEELRDDEPFEEEDRDRDGLELERELRDRLELPLERLERLFEDRLELLFDFDFPLALAVCNSKPDIIAVPKNMAAIANVESDRIRVWAIMVIPNFVCGSIFQAGRRERPESLLI